MERMNQAVNGSKQNDLLKEDAGGLISALNHSIVVVERSGEKDMLQRFVAHQLVLSYRVDRDVLKTGPGHLAGVC